MTRLPDDVPDCMVFLLAKAYQKAHGSFKKKLLPYGLTNLQHLVLEALWYSPGMTAAALCKFLILDKATLSGVLDRMSRDGWIEKRKDPSDRRLLSLFPSAKANKIKEDLIRKRKKANEEILTGFSTEERLLFRRFLIDVVSME